MPIWGMKKVTKEQWANHVGRFNYRTSLTAAKDYIIRHSSTSEELAAVLYKNGQPEFWISPRVASPRRRQDRGKA